MKIPKQFDISDQTITSEWVSNLRDREDATGMARYRENTIELQDPQTLPRPWSQVEFSFCHELVHWILYLIGEEKLQNNEVFVSRFARALHQFLNTAEYEGD